MPNRLLLAAARRDWVRRLIVRRKMTRRVAYRFVAGESVDDALRAAQDLGSSGITSILDYLGESVTSEPLAEEAAAAYHRSLRELPASGLDAHVSVKLSQLGISLSSEACYARMEKLCRSAADAGTTVEIDMESHEHTEATIATYRRLRSDHDNVVLCLQAYLKRTPSDVESLLPLDPRIRLCKGAYDEPPDISFDRLQTRRSYADLLRKLLSETTFTAVATHDDRMIEEAKRLAPADRFEFQMLYGVRRELQSSLVEQGYRVRVYIPFGDQWYPYLMRRMAERPANLRLFLEALSRG